MILAGVLLVLAALGAALLSPFTERDFEFLLAAVFLLVSGVAVLALGVLA